MHVALLHLSHSHSSISGLLLPQVILGCVRPPVGPSKLRVAWQMSHYNVGRIAMLSAWASVYLGIALFASQGVSQGQALSIQYSVQPVE